MKVGLTYDMRSEYLKEGYGELATAEFESEDTIEGIEQNLRRLGHGTERIGSAPSLMRALAAGRRWDLVFNVCEGLHGFGREALVPALLDSFQIPYTFSDPLVLTLALHKGAAKHFVRDMGVPTPEFTVVEDPDDVAAVNLPFPLFAKPVAEGTGKGIDASCKIDSTDALREVCLRLLRDFRQPVLVERYLPGREFTAGVVGTGREAEMAGVMEVILKPAAEPYAYSYQNKEHYDEVVEYRAVEAGIRRACEMVVLPVWRGLGCRDAGRVDLKMDERGQVQFLELNPLAGLNEIRSDLPILCRMNGMAYPELIARIIQSAQKRIGKSDGGS